MLLAICALTLFLEAQMAGGAFSLSHMRPSCSLGYRGSKSYKVGNSFYDDGVWASDHRPVISDIFIGEESWKQLICSVLVFCVTKPTTGVLTMDPGLFSAVQCCRSACSSSVWVMRWGSCCWKCAAGLLSTVPPTHPRGVFEVPLLTLWRVPETSEESGFPWLVCHIESMDGLKNVDSIWK